MSLDAAWRGGGNGSGATGLRAFGEVVGGSGPAAGQYHAFITGPAGMGMTDLGGEARVTGIQLCWARVG
jgi:probable HAF family extracellular repeat protein